MARTFHLLIVTQEGVKFEGDVESARLPGAEGYFGVRVDHAAMIAALGVGAIRFKQPGSEPQVMACSGGMARVSPRETVVLGDSVEDAAEIDQDRAKQAEQRARERLHKRSDEDVDASRAAAALARAANRLKVKTQGL